MRNPARHAHLSIALLLLALLPSAASAQTGSWTFGAITTASYRLDAVSSPAIFSGALGAADPTLTLTLGSRYEVTVASGHPLAIVAKGATAASDIVLLQQGGGPPGSLESDAGIQWVDGGGKVTFTVTQTLVNAMNVANHQPGYHCGAHPGTMRGNFTIVDPPPLIPLFGATAWLALVALLVAAAWWVKPRARASA